MKKARIRAKRIEESCVCDQADHSNNSDSNELDDDDDDSRRHSRNADGESQGELSEKTGRHRRSRIHSRTPDTLEEARRLRDFDAERESGGDRGSFQRPGYGRPEVARSAQAAADYGRSGGEEVAPAWRWL